MGKIQIASGDYLGAIRTFEGIRKTDPGTYESLVYLGVAYYRSGQYEKALSLYDEMLERTLLLPSPGRTAGMHW